MKEIEPIAGFRFWRVKGDVLRSINGAAWTPGEPLRAKHLGDAESCEGDYCLCGVNAFYSLSNLVTCGDDFQPAMEVAGIVSACDEAVLCETGFRAKEAKLEALIFLADPPILGASLIEPRLKELADNYGVPLLRIDEVEGFLAVEGLTIQEDLFDAENELPAPEWEAEGYAAGTYHFAWGSSPPRPFNPQGPQGKSVRQSISSAQLLQNSITRAHVQGRVFGILHVVEPDPDWKRFLKVLKALAVWRKEWPL